jgi:hypothetical protein
MLAVDADRNGRKDRVAEDAGPFDVGDGLPLLRGEGDAVVDRRWRSVTGRDSRPGRPPRKAMK